MSRIHRIAIFGWLGLCLCGAARAEQTRDGFVIPVASRFSANTSESIGGKRSIVGTNTGDRQYTDILRSDPAFIRLEGGARYTVRFRYKVLAAPEKGCEFLFYSPSAAKVDQWLPSKSFGTTAGEVGEVEFSATLLEFNDYLLWWNVIGAGSVALDDIRLNREAMVEVANASFEDPEIVQGLLPFALSEPLVLNLGAEGQDYVLRSMTMRDLNGDGTTEAILTISTYPDQLLEPIIILGSDSVPIDLTRRLLPGGTPKVRHSPHTFFADLDGDGREDIVFAEAGLDHEPWTGSRILVLLATAAGTFRDVSDRIPRELWETRSYGLGVGDFDQDGKPEILLPDQLADGTHFLSSLLSWEKGGFTAVKDWIDRELWYWPEKFLACSPLLGADLDRDGKTDLIAGGGWERPNTRIIWGSATGYVKANVVILPEGPFGHTEWDEWITSGMPSCQGADANTIIPADFDKDGNTDFFILQEQILTYKPGAITDRRDPGYRALYAKGGGTGGRIALQVFMGKGGRSFVDYSAASSRSLLDRTYYSGNVVQDLNGDGFLDVVAIYWTKPYAGLRVQTWGSTFFLNDGTGAFQVVDGSEFLPHWRVEGETRARQMGAFLPTLVGRNRMEGIFVEVDGDYVSGTLSARSGICEGALGTGPGHADGAAPGYPGFNEFYYLRTHPDAASAIAAGQYENGLEHYKAVGSRRGYQAFAANATVKGGSGQDLLTLACKINDATISKVDGGIQLVDSSGRYGRLRLESIEAIRFSDGELSLVTAR